MEHFGKITFNLRPETKHHNFELQPKASKVAKVFRSDSEDNDSDIEKGPIQKRSVASVKKACSERYSQ